MSADSIGLPILHYQHFKQQQPAAVMAYFWERKRSEVLKLFKRNLARLIPKDAERIVFVDLGCGHGEDLLLYKQFFDECHPGVHFIGVDIQFRETEPLLRTAGIEYMTSNFAKKLPFGNREIDILYCSEVIEHLPAPEILLQEIRRALKSTGHLILTTPNSPLIFQRSYWSPSRHKKVIEEGLAADDANPTFIEVDGEAVRVYGHVSAKTTREWDKILCAEGFQKVDCGRASTAYGSESIFSNAWIVPAFFWLETAIELMPRKLVQGFCSQHIGMYCLR